MASIVSNYNTKGQINAIKRGGDHSSKLSIEQKILIKSWVDEDATITLKELSNKLNISCGLNVSTSTINRCLNNFHYTLKNLTLVPVRRNTPSTIEHRFTYAQNFNTKLLEIDDKNLIFIDEVGFSVVCRTKYGRSLIGSSAYIRVGGVKSRNISVIAAMNKYGMVSYKINHRPVNGEDFKQYLIELLNLCNSTGIDNPCFILDNARIHHYHGLKHLIEELGLTLLYLPPYSPFLNPIENCFSKWKNYVIRRQSRNEEELFNYINSGFEMITSSDCTGYFQKMLRYIVKCLNRNEILE